MRWQSCKQLNSERDRERARFQRESVLTKLTLAAHSRHKKRGRGYVSFPVVVSSRSHHLFAPFCAPPTVHTTGIKGEPFFSLLRLYSHSLQIPPFIVQMVCWGWEGAQQQSFCCYPPPGPPCMFTLLFFCVLSRLHRKTAALPFLSFSLMLLIAELYFDTIFCNGYGFFFLFFLVFAGKMQHIFMCF